MESLALQHGHAPHEVVEAVTDAFASVLGWDDATAPRALTILTAALTVLTAVNQTACQAGQLEDQATLFQIRPLLTDPDFRAAALAATSGRLDADTRSWWQTVFPHLPADAFAVVLNPLARLAAHPVTRAFLGQPSGVYNSRAAMDNQLIVWICPAGTGPTDRLVTALIARDLLRAVRSRRDTPEQQRRPFRLYFDELITLTGAAPETIAAMFEDFRKYRVSVHGMTQLLGRLPAPVRMSLTQNASTLASTAGSTAAIAPITAEWGDTPTPHEVAALDRFEHYTTVTVHGRRIGPLRLTGPHLNDVFADQARPHHTRALEAAAHTTARARPLTELTATAAAQQARVTAFVTQHAAITPPTRPSTENGDTNDHHPCPAPRPLGHRSLSDRRPTPDSNPPSPASVKPLPALWCCRASQPTDHREGAVTRPGAALRREVAATIECRSSATTPKPLALCFSKQ